MSRNGDTRINHATYYNNKQTCHENKEMEPVQPVHMAISQS